MVKNGSKDISEKKNTKKCDGNNQLDFILKEIELIKLDFEKYENIILFIVDRIFKTGSLRGGDVDIFKKMISGLTKEEAELDALKKIKGRVVG